MCRTKRQRGGFMYRETNLSVRKAKLSNATGLRKDPQGRTDAPVLPTDSFSASDLSVYPERELCVSSEASGASTRRTAVDSRENVSE